MTKPLTPKQEQFCREYLVDLNATQAAIRAGYSAKTARAAGARLLTDVDIQTQIQNGMDKRATDVGINAKHALQLIWDRATADPRELVEVRVSCCRYCYGTEHKYQRTLGEMATARKNWESNGNDPSKFDEQGGVGYSPNRQPVESCPECHGDGVPRVLIKDTRTVSKAAASLFAGAKHGKHGIEVLLHDQGKHIEMAGRNLKLFVDRLEVEQVDSLAARLERVRAKRAAK